MQYYTSGSFAVSGAVDGKKTCFGIAGKVCFLLKMAQPISLHKARAWFNKIG